MDGRNNMSWYFVVRIGALYPKDFGRLCGPTPYWYLVLFDGCLWYGMRPMQDGMQFFLVGAAFASRGTCDVTSEVPNFIQKKLSTMWNEELYV